MEQKNSAVKWYLIAAIGTLFFCMCLVGVTALVIPTWIARQANLADTGSTLLPDAPTPTAFVPSSEVPEDQNLAVSTKAQLAEVVVPENDRIELAKRLKSIVGIPRILAESADEIPVGTEATFWVGNVDTIEHFQRDAELVYASDHVYFWIQKGVDYEFEDVKDLVDDFEAHAYPTNRKFFGSEWSPGIDGDEHLYILYAEDLGYSVAGYFSTADELSPQANEYSNAHEMFYLSADNIELWEEFTYSVLAHEFQHMIHWSLDRNEESWVNEGFSELASHLSGFDVGGWDYAYADDPDLALTYWPTNGQTHYGQAFLFMAYFLDRFGSHATQMLVANPVNGLESIDQTLNEIGAVDPVTGEPVGADDVFQDWTVTMLLDDPTIAEGKYSYVSYQPPSVGMSDHFSSCPVENETREVNQYGIDYLRISCDGDYTLTFEGATMTPVLPSDPHSGAFMFWSNRGDESDMTLTRAFDFREVEGPIKLSYWVWYDIEEGWDYLYLEASTDGGSAWEILETPSGTDEDSSGNSYGWAYTCFSGSGFEPEWIEERVSLDQFAGQEVLLRFEYITDAAVNGDGLLLDDISIEAIDYFEDFEQDEGGWEAAGFVRLFNRLPQTYRVMLVQHGPETRVTEIPLDDLQRGEISFSNGGDFEEATLLVMGTTRHTWQPAPYSVSINPAP